MHGEYERVLDTGQAVPYLWDAIVSMFRRFVATFQEFPSEINDVRMRTTLLHDLQRSYLLELTAIIQNSEVGRLPMPALWTTCYA